MGIHCTKAVLQKVKLILEAKGRCVELLVDREWDGMPLTSRNKTTGRLLAARCVSVAVTVLRADGQGRANKAAHPSLHCNRGRLIQSPHNDRGKESVNLVVNNVERQMSLRPRALFARTLMG